MFELVNIFNYVYEVLKQIIIILEGLSIINFIYKFIQNKCKPKYESLTIDLKSEITKLSELTKERTKNIELKSHFYNLKSEVTKERTKNAELETKLSSLNNGKKNYDELKSHFYNLKSEVTKERTKNAELETKLSDLKSELTKERINNTELYLKNYKQNYYIKEN
jgi:predicted RNase H-like nuclease (RuvC/YqgF family)